MGQACQGDACNLQLMSATSRKVASGYMKPAVVHVEPFTIKIKRCAEIMVWLCYDTWKRKSQL